MKKRKINIDDINAVFNQIIDRHDEVNEKERGITISIDKLPECDHKKFLMNYVTEPSTCKICIIAQWGPIATLSGNWVAYAGYPDMKDLKSITDEGTAATLEWDCQHIHNAEQVKLLGTILDRDTAHIIFPDWDITKYIVSPAVR